MTWREMTSLIIVAVLGLVALAGVGSMIHGGIVGKEPTVALTGVVSAALGALASHLTAGPLRPINGNGRDKP